VDYVQTARTHKDAVFTVLLRVEVFKARTGSLTMLTGKLPVRIEFPEVNNFGTHLIFVQAKKYKDGKRELRAYFTWKI
jgi:hypothetical protein